MFPTQSALLCLAVLMSPALDDGRYGRSPLKPWFESLESEIGKCCTDADGYIVTDADWESVRGRYRVRIDNEWIDVPENAVVKQPNLFGRTMVWRHYIDGHPRVRCFMPGSMI
jgi:hypothetical protein